MPGPTPSRAFSSFICQSCRRRLLPTARSARPFTTSPTLRAESQDALSGLNALNRTPTTPSRRRSPPTTPSTFLSELDRPAPDPFSLITSNQSASLNATDLAAKPYRLHIYAHKHNTHITLVQPPRTAAQTTSSAISGTSARAADQKKIVDVLLSFSTGNINFRKAGRGSYDAAYQLAAFTIKQMGERGILSEIRNVEIVMRGFGAGREAVTKALLGSEGRGLRGKISAVVDATRLKLGGPRSKKPRRLG